MAGRPKERRLKTKLAEIAKREIGPGATSVDWVVQKVADGVTIGKIAGYLAQEMNETVSRSFLSWYINHATPDAKARIKEARKKRPMSGPSRRSTLRSDRQPRRLKCSRLDCNS